MAIPTIELGDRVKDRVTQLEGIVVGIHQYLNGCNRMSIQPPLDPAKPNDHPDSFVIDDVQLVITQKRAFDNSTVPNHADYETGQEALASAAEERKPGGPVERVRPDGI